MPELRQRRSSCRSPVENAGPGSRTCRPGRGHGEGVDARVEATQKRLTDGPQAPSGVTFSLLRASCPPPFGPASLFAPLLRRSGDVSLGHAREKELGRRSCTKALRFRQRKLRNPHSTLDEIHRLL